VAFGLFKSYLQPHFSAGQNLLAIAVMVKMGPTPAGKKFTIFS
jgi:hypothetical protein